MSQQKIRIGAALSLGLVGCQSVLGLDEYSFSEPNEGAGAGGSAEQGAEEPNAAGSGSAPAPDDEGGGAGGSSELGTPTEGELDDGTGAPGLLGNAWLAASIAWLYESV